MSNKEDGSETSIYFIIPILIIGIIAFSHTMEVMKDNAKCSNSLYVCEDTNIAKFERNNVSCISNYQNHGFLAEPTTHTCEDYGQVKEQCIKGRSITRAQSNDSACHDMGGDSFLGKLISDLN